MIKQVSPFNTIRVIAQTLRLVMAIFFMSSNVLAQEVPNLFAGETTQKEKPMSLPTSQIENTAEEFVEKMVFDVYAVGHYHGTVLVNFTDNWVEIENPMDVLDQMPVVKNTMAFKPLLTGKIYTNKEKKVAGVGSVIADPANFRISISVDQEQAVAQTREEQLINKSTANYVSFSNRMRLTGTTDLDPSKSDTLGLTLNSFLSRGAWRMQFGGNYIKNQGYDFQSALVEHNIGDNIYSVGMLRTDGLTFVAGEDLYGLEFKSNQLSLNNIYNYLATPIEIFVPSRGTVRIYRNNNQIIYAQPHDFGFATIDTKRFPTGSYDIRIDIVEDTGVITEERRFFQKNPSLTAREHPTFKFTAGIQRKGLDLLSTPVYQFSYAQRAFDNVELSANLYGTGTSFAIEPKLRGFFGNGYEYTTSLSYTSEKDLAFSGRIQYAPKNLTNGLSWFINAQQTLLGHNQDYTNFDKFDFIQNISQKKSTIQGNINYVYNSVTWAFSLDRSKFFKNISTYNYGPSFDWRLYIKNGHQLTLNSNIMRSKGSTNHNIFLSYRYKPNLSNWDYKSSIGSTSSANNTVKKIAQDISFNNQRANSLGTNFNANNSLQVNGNKKTTTSNISLSHDTKYASAAVNYTNLDGNKVKSSETIDYALDSTFLLTQDDFLDHDKRSYNFSPSTGGQSNNIIVTLLGNAVGEEVVINLNGIPKYYAKVGEIVSFSIPDYDGGELTITPSNNTTALLDYDETPVSIHLYPGNVAQQEWTINKIFLIMGRAVNDAGKPITWQRIEGLKDYATTDSNGYFQLEMTGAEMPYINTSKTKCVFALPPINQEESFRQVGDIICG